ncbi:IPT/TIG domain-containing protein [Sphingobacterium siyangense]|uniref:IPT/TIG domain-containing protein n=1 Tax=Sphingobacterium siyangense TaxID=459529 RepID=UPI003DA4E228
MRKNHQHSIFICLLLGLQLLFSCSKDDPNTHSSDGLVTIISINPESAYIGETVTINGKNFGNDPDALTVKFKGDALAKIKKANDTEIDVIVPDGAETGEITVTRQGKSPVSSPKSFSVLATDISILSFAPVSGNIGDLMTIKGNGFGRSSEDILITIGEGEGIKPLTVSPTEITLAVTQGTTGKVSVIKQGKTASSTNDFTFPPKVNHVVKTIGISAVHIALDEKEQLVVADLFGEGNRIVLRKGTGNKMRLETPGFSTAPRFEMPHGFLPELPAGIDNGNPGDTTGTRAAVFKLTGFNKAETGFDQLNIVVHDLVLPYHYHSGWFVNLRYLNYIERIGKKNDDYGVSFLKQLFSGDVQVSTMTIAPPRSQNPYLIQDIVVTNAIIAIDPIRNYTYQFNLTGGNYRAFFIDAPNNPPTFPLNIGTAKIKAEWVNTSLAKVSKSPHSDYDYSVTFSNSLTGNHNVVVDNRDTIDRPFIRLTGFDNKICGFDQLRVFLVKEGPYDTASIDVVYTSIPTRPPTAKEILEAFTRTEALKCSVLSPKWPEG